ncbi:MAG: hypothetical protein ACI9P7_001507, partial [Candidatus Azotimanducaceae bacterium]
MIGSRFWSDSQYGCADLGYPIFGVGTWLCNLDLIIGRHEQAFDFTVPLAFGFPRGIPERSPQC